MDAFISTTNLPVPGPQNPNPPTSGYVGLSIGQWMRKNQSKIIIGLLIMFVIFVFFKLLQQISDAETMEANASIIGAAAAYTNSIRHKKCQSRGGCSRKCPYISKDDPRVIMCQQADDIELINNSLRQGLEEDRISLDTAVSRLSEKEQKSISDELQAIQAIKVRSSSNISAILTKAKSLDQQFGQSPTVTVAVINAKNRIAALASAANINKNIYIAAVVRATSCVMNSRVQDVPSVDQSRITSYDTKALECKIHSVSIKDHYDTLSAVTADSIIDGTYGALMKDLQNDSITTDHIIATMAMMMNCDKDSHISLTTILAKFDIVLEVFDYVSRKLDSFSNDLPGVINSDQISSLIADGDYNTAVIRTALEPEIVSNHQKFAKERATFDSGGGVPSIRDDDNDIIKWVGIFGRPTYRRSDGTSADVSSEPLRSIPSDNPDNLMRKNTPRLSFK